MARELGKLQRPVQDAAIGLGALAVAGGPAIVVARRPACLSAFPALSAGSPYVAGAATATWAAWPGPVELAVVAGWRCWRKADLYDLDAREGFS